MYFLVKCLKCGVVVSCFIGSPYKLNNFLYTKFSLLRPAPNDIFVRIVIKKLFLKTLHCKEKRSILILSKKYILLYILENRILINLDNFLFSKIVGKERRELQEQIFHSRINRLVYSNLKRL